MDDSAWSDSHGQTIYDASDQQAWLEEVMIDNRYSVQLKNYKSSLRLTSLDSP